MGPDFNARRDEVAVIFDYSSFSGSLIVDNLRCTLGIGGVGVINVTDPMHVPKFEKWATIYDDYDAAISDFVRTGYWPVLLATTLHNVEAPAGKVHDLRRYRHPDKTVYVVGPDSGPPALYKHLYTLCNDVVTIPSDDREMYAVSAIAITLWDRTVKDWFADLLITTKLATG